MAGMETDTIKELYTKFKYNELSFTDTVLKSSGIISRDIFLRSGKRMWPCTIVSASMNGIKLSLKLKEEETQLIAAAESVKVHFSFMGFKPYFIPLSFTQPYQLFDTKSLMRLKDTTCMLSLSCLGKPSDFLIRILGDLLTMHAATTKRTEVRISVTNATAADLGLKSTSIMIRIGDIRQECFIQDLSFSGCQVLISIPGSVEKKKIVLELLFRDPDELCEMPGTVMRYAPMRGNRERGTAGILFDPEQIPHEYTGRLHSLLD